MLPSLIVPCRCDSPRNELRFEKPLVPTPSMPIDCSTCQMPLKPLLPRPLSPRKPRYVFCESTARREPLSLTAAPPRTPVEETSVETESPGCVAPLLLPHRYSG